MKMIIKDNVYELDRDRLNGVLKLANTLFRNVPKYIYAVQKDDICELKNERFYNDEDLNKAVKEYEDKGFKVMYSAR